MSNGGGHWCVSERVIDRYEAGGRTWEEYGDRRLQVCIVLQLAGNVTRQSSSSSDGKCYEKSSSQPSEQNTCCLAFCQP